MILTVAVCETGEPFTSQEMVKSDWEEMVTDCGEPVVKAKSSSEEPEASVPPGPDTVQEVTPVPLQDICEVLPEFTRVGLAEIVASGASTSTVAKDGDD